MSPEILEHATRAFVLLQFLYPQTCEIHLARARREVAARAATQGRPVEDVAVDMCKVEAGAGWVLWSLSLLASVAPQNRKETT